VVEALLKDLNQDAYEFLIGFARDDKLVVRAGHGKLRIDDAFARRLV
jgi:hypothetical protein